MTNYEVIRNLNLLVSGDCTEPVNEYAEEVEIATKALEKQMPIKPTYDGDGYAPDGTFIWDEWLCPNCGERYEVDYDDYNYCPSCGQAIDWSRQE